MNYFFISTFVPCFVLVPLIVGLINFPRHKKYDRIIFFYIIISGMVDLVVSVLAYNRINNLPVFHVFTVIEFILLSLFFNSIYKRKIYSIITFITIGIFILLAILNSFFLQDLYKFNTYTRSVEAIILICYCVYYFYHLISSNEDVNYSVTWHVSGMFIYFSASSILFIMSNVTLTINKELNWILWHIHSAMLLIMYIFITIGFYIGKKRR